MWLVSLVASGNPRICSQSGVWEGLESLNLQLVTEVRSASRGMCLYPVKFDLTLVVRLRIVLCVDKYKRPFFSLLISLEFLWLFNAQFTTLSDGVRTELYPIKFIF